MQNVLEVCVDSVESAIAAEKGGADRFELCGHLMIGGVTPSKALFQGVKRTCSIPVNVLIRPRFGDFLYTDYEFAMICEEVTMYRELGADGLVIGMLKDDGNLDAARMEKLIALAGEAKITLHRAFDVCSNPMKALREAKDWGIHTILTSGQGQNCREGKELLKELVQEAGDEIQILVGAGVNAKVIEELAPYTKAHQFHMSGKTVLDSGMVYRKQGVNMGLPNLSEYEIWRTDEEEIRKARAALDSSR